MRATRGGALRRVLDGLALTLFAAFLVVAVPQAVMRAAGMLNLAQYARGESAEAGRVRLEGEPYVRGIDAIRAAVLADEPYLLVEGGRLTDGDTYWVRYDLAPRRAILLGRLADMAGAGPAIRRLGSRLRHVVVAYGHGAPPRLYDRFEFVEELDRRAAGAAGEAGAGDAAASVAAAGEAGAGDAEASVAAGGRGGASGGAAAATAGAAAGKSGAGGTGDAHPR
jgi:hypothetical protein